jgi:hypothetical protein
MGGDLTYLQIVREVETTCSFGYLKTSPLSKRVLTTRSQCTAAKEALYSRERVPGT